jgi:hypothetical protein
VTTRNDLVQAQKTLATAEQRASALGIEVPVTPPPVGHTKIRFAWVVVLLAGSAALFLVGTIALMNAMSG